jgi:hypothetical protein
MRYKCIANPHCLKTFDYGHALRAHLASCEHAQKMLRSRAEVERMEAELALEYPGMYGLHRNTYYPTAHGLDKTSKFYFTDKYKFTPNQDKLKAAYTRQKKGITSNLFDSTQVKSSLTYNL